MNVSIIRQNTPMYLGNNFGVNEIRTLLDQWKEEEENNEELAE